MGNTNYAIAYELPTAGGQGNRARFGVTTALPLTDRWTTGLRGSAVYDLTAQSAELGAGADFNYKSDTVSATVGGDSVYRGSEFGVVLRSGISGSLSENLTLSANGLTEFGAGKNGNRLALGYAYRNSTFNSLGTVRYVNGTLANNAPELSSDFAVEYHLRDSGVRGYLDTRNILNDEGSFTAQAGLNGQAYLSDSLAIGAWGHVMTQPASETTQYGYGIEGSVKVIPGTWLSVGYNPVGFSGIGQMYTKQGLYLRLDMALDETLNGLKK